MRGLVDRANKDVNRGAVRPEAFLSWISFASSPILLRAVLLLLRPTPRDCSVSIPCCNDFLPQQCLSISKCTWSCLGHHSHFPPHQPSEGLASLRSGVIHCFATDFIASIRVAAGEVDRRGGDLAWAATIVRNVQCSRASGQEAVHAGRSSRCHGRAGHGRLRGRRRWRRWRRLVELCCCSSGRWRRWRRRRDEFGGCRRGRWRRWRRRWWSGLRGCCGFRCRGLSLLVSQSTI
jgi:hypothetical protein